MKSALRFIPAAFAGLLAGWLLSGWLIPDPGPVVRAPPKAKPASAAGEILGGTRTAWKKLMEARSLPANADMVRVYRGLMEFMHDTGASPARRKLETEYLRSSVPADRIEMNLVMSPTTESAAGSPEMLARQSKNYPARALNTLQFLASNHQRWDSQSVERAHRLIYREYVRSNPKGALAEALRTARVCTSIQFRNAGLRLLMEEWSRIDPPAAATALTSLPEGGPGFQRKDFAETVLRGWSETDPVAARAWAGAPADPALRETLTTLTAELEAKTPAEKAAVFLAAPHRDSSKLTAAISEWLTVDPSTALTKLSAIPPADSFWTQDAATTAERWAAGALATTTPNQFLESIQRVPAGAQRDAILKGLAGYGAVKDIPFAVRMVGEMGEGQARSDAMTGLTEHWTRSDPVALSEWLATQSSGESRHAAVSRYSELLAKSDPEAAVRWAETIPDNFPGKENLVRNIRTKLQAINEGKASKPQ